MWEALKDVAGGMLGLVLVAVAVGLLTWWADRRDARRQVRRFDAVCQRNDDEMARARQRRGGAA